MIQKKKKKKLKIINCKHLIVFNKKEIIYYFQIEEQKRTTNRIEIEGK